MSAAGSLSKYKKISGFTLIELIVVISIISTLLVFSFPLFRGFHLFSSSSSQVGDIARLIDDLKIRAVQQNVDFLMHMETGSNTIWVTHEGMDDETKEMAKEKGVKVSSDFSILDVELPGIKQAGVGEYQIRFKKQGYSDFVLIHIIDDKNNFTIKVEPFLSKVQVLDRHIYLEDCI